MSRYFIFPIVAFCPFLCDAQVTGFSFELDTLFGEMSQSNPLVGLENHAVYDVYAELTNPSDVLVGLFSDSAALGTPPMGIDAPCGCWNPVDDSWTLGSENNSIFWTQAVAVDSSFAAFEYDTFWTIGKRTFDEPGNTPLWVSQPNMDGANICSSSITNGAVFAVWDESSNLVAGDDLKILIARVATCEDFTIKACTQTLVEGDFGQQAIECSELYVPFIGCAEPDACNTTPMSQ